ncbi:MAG: peptide chain release factor N(5)-glutamine methyltransferase [Bacteroidales bacterium]|jgi:release factor glutamine methyltransferase|nr:peptide chain release factor N(5)-glutamine methyltransferase [Bacteroidales bacterium]
MNKEEFLSSLIAEWENKLHILGDKPEENADAIIRALWLKASGVSVSVQKATGLPLPDLNDKQKKELLKLIGLRAGNYPTAYLTGKQCFMGIELIVDKRALIPRKETELLCSICLDLTEKMQQNTEIVKIMDICCGSGNLGIALASYNSNCTVYASDISHDAVDLTIENISFLDLHKRVVAKQGDMMAAFDSPEFYEKIDLIMCNPPYIFSSKVPQMHPEISENEPGMAFDGGALGIGIIKRLLQDSPAFLKKEAWIAFEVGLGQGGLITMLLERSGVFTNIGTGKDDSDNIRVVYAQKI